MGQKSNFSVILQSRMTDTEYIKFLETQVMEMNDNINTFLRKMDKAHFNKKSSGEAIMKAAYANNVELLLNTTATGGN